MLQIQDIYYILIYNANKHKYSEEMLNSQFLNVQS